MDRRFGAIVGRILQMKHMGPIAPAFVALVYSASRTLRSYRSRRRHTRLCATGNPRLWWAGKKLHVRGMVCQHGTLPVDLGMVSHPTVEPRAGKVQSRTGTIRSSFFRTTARFMVLLNNRPSFRGIRALV